MTPCAASALLRAALQGLAQTEPTLGSDFAYPSPVHFLLAHGQPYRPAPRPSWLPVGAPKCCYANSLYLGCWFALQYVEGYGLLALNGETPMAMPHAWLTDGRGVALEVTTSFPWLAYLGMPFSLERADDATWYGDSCVLDDWQRAHPLLRTAYAGEPPLPHYRPSLSMRRLRELKRARGILFGCRPPSPGRMEDLQRAEEEKP